MLVSAGANNEGVPGLEITERIPDRIHFKEGMEPEKWTPTRFVAGSGCGEFNLIADVPCTYMLMGRNKSLCLIIV